MGTIVIVAHITWHATLNHVMTLRSLTWGCMQTVTCSTRLCIHWHENRFRCWTAWLPFLQHPGTHRRWPVTKYLRRGFCQPRSYTDTNAGVLFCFMAWQRRRHSPLVVQVMSKVLLEMSAVWLQFYSVFRQLVRFLYVLLLSKIGAAAGKLFTLFLNWFPV